jgi:hypothetical protein
MPLDSSVPPFRPSPSRPFTALRRYAFDDGDQRVDCGSAVVVAPEAEAPPCSAPSLGEEEYGFSLAEAQQFLAGGPLTLGWVTQSPSANGSVYVYCWVTIGD